MFMVLWLGVAAAAPISVMAPAFQTQGLESTTAGAVVDRFVTELARTEELKVMSGRDLAAALGFERQKQLLGCGDESSSCLAELAGSLGSDVLLTGNIVKVGESFTVNVRFIRVRDGLALVTASERLPTVDAVQDWLDRQAHAAPEKLRRSFGGEQVAPPVAPWVVLSASLVVAAAGLASVLWASADLAELKTATELSRINQLAASGPIKQGVGIGLLVGGGVGAVASLVWALVGRPSSAPAVTFFASPQGGGLVVQGVWP